MIDNIDPTALNYNFNGGRTMLSRLDEEEEEIPLNQDGTVSVRSMTHEQLARFSIFLDSCSVKKRKKRKSILY